MLFWVRGGSTVGEGGKAIFVEFEGESVNFGVVIFF